MRKHWRTKSASGRFSIQPATDFADIVYKHISPISSPWCSVWTGKFGCAWGGRNQEKIAPPIEVVKWIRLCFNPHRWRRRAHQSRPPWLVSHRYWNLENKKKITWRWTKIWPKIVLIVIMMWRLAYCWVTAAERQSTALFTHLQEEMSTTNSKKRGRKD